MNEKKIISALVVFQLFFIVVGWLFTHYFVKINGRNIPGMADELWPASVLFVKGYFLWFILVSLMVFGYFIYEQLNEMKKEKSMLKHYLISGLFLGICLVVAGKGIIGAVNGPQYTLINVDEEKAQLDRSHNSE
ncbi:hypothetical protein [Rubellicoccus peritrichatus]|uniref:Uncharacterized protein n=1 Tax=Rubellicoccus peritrichatus TaxID=3080537 RepID=A0AAQ3LAQ1_9BACT|nr:hypothetical protein [Puniceicoccus sp. CR14]WOO42659.1 hypothetical protein RZN69_06110 [Puniceicoccus sp. CR14]